MIFSRSSYVGNLLKTSSCHEAASRLETLSQELHQSWSADVCSPSSSRQRRRYQGPCNPSGTLCSCNWCVILWFVVRQLRLLLQVVFPVGHHQGGLEDLKECGKKYFSINIVKLCRNICQYAIGGPFYISNNGRKLTKMILCPALLC